MIMSIYNIKVQKNNLSLINKVLIVFIPVLLLNMTIGSENLVFAGGDNNNEVSCFERGIIDGEDHPFSHKTYDKCGDDYYQGFLEGCMSVEGNDRDICESATDA